jgi:hypothetical protein
MCLTPLLDNGADFIDATLPLIAGRAQDLTVCDSYLLIPEQLYIEDRVPQLPS